MTVARRPAARGGLLRSVLFLVALGVLGMHGIDSHGAGPSHGPPLDHGIHPVSAQAVTTSALDVEAERVVLAPPPDTDGAGSLVGLCMAAVLTAALVLLVLRWIRRRVPALRACLDRRRPLRLPCGRYHAPPSLAHLSVMRC